MPPHHNVLSAAGSKSAGRDIAIELVVYPAQEFARCRFRECRARAISRQRIVPFDKVAVVGIHAPSVGAERTNSAIGSVTSSEGVSSLVGSMRCGDSEDTLADVLRGIRRYARRGGGDGIASARESSSGL